jgi:hypothetical protein
MERIALIRCEADERRQIRIARFDRLGTAHDRGDPEPPQRGSPGFTSKHCAVSTSPHSVMSAITEMAASRARVQSVFSRAQNPAATAVAELGQ